MAGGAGAGIGIGDGVACFCTGVGAVFGNGGGIVGSDGGSSRASITDGGGVISHTGV